MVGRSVVDYSQAKNYVFFAHDHRSLDITNELKVNAALDRDLPEVVINCAAWTAVDQCELDPERAQNVNAYGPELLALGVRRFGAFPITISTPYLSAQLKHASYPHPH